MTYVRAQANRITDALGTWRPADTAAVEAVIAEVIETAGREADGECCAVVGCSNPDHALAWRAGARVRSLLTREGA